MSGFDDCMEALARCEEELNRCDHSADSLLQQPSSSNGRTLGFGPRNRGSNPCEGAAIAMARDSAANGDLPVPQDCQARLSPNLLNQRTETMPSVTYPPEMLPVSRDGDADVVVCMGECGNEPPCPLCVVIRPGDDPDKPFRQN